MKANKQPKAPKTPTPPQLAGKPKTQATTCRGDVRHAQAQPQLLDAGVLRYIYHEARNRYHQMKETTVVLDATYLTPIAFRAVHASCRVHLQKKKAASVILEYLQEVRAAIVKEDVSQAGSNYEEKARNSQDNGKIPTWEELLKEIISFLSALEDPKPDRLQQALAEIASASSTNLQKLGDLRKMYADQMRELNELQDILGATEHNAFETRMRIVLSELTHTHEALKSAALKRPSGGIRAGQAEGWTRQVSKTDDGDSSDNESSGTDGSEAYHYYPNGDNAWWRVGKSNALTDMVKRARQNAAKNFGVNTLTGNNLLRINDFQAGRRTVSMHSRASRIDSQHLDARQNNMFVRMARLKLQVLTTMTGTSPSMAKNPKKLMRKNGQRKTYFENMLGTGVENDNEALQSLLKDPRKSATIVRRSVPRGCESVVYCTEGHHSHATEVQEMSLDSHCFVPDLPAMQPGSAMHCRHRLPRDNLKNGFCGAGHHEVSQSSKLTVSKSPLFDSISRLSRPATVSISIFERGPQTARNKPLRSCDLQRPWTSIQGAPGITTFQPLD